MGRVLFFAVQMTQKPDFKCRLFVGSDKVTTKRQISAHKKAAFVSYCVCEALTAVLQRRILCGCVCCALQAHISRRLNAAFRVSLFVRFLFCRFRCALH